MFNGIVEITGIVKQITITNQCLTFTILPENSFTDLFIGESVAINGVCLTVTLLSTDTFSVTIVPETLRLTNLGNIAIGDLVNLERAMLSTSRISGHYVQGHVDTAGEIIDIKPEGEALLVKIAIPTTLSKYVVNKGYIALDGMSITVIEAKEDWFSVTFIPHTQAVTIINQYRIGSKINIEIDILGKYVEKLLGAHAHAIAY